MFRNMSGECTRRGGRCVTGKSRAACKPVDWRQAFAFATGGGSRADCAEPGPMAPFPAFLGALTEALVRKSASRQQPIQREADRKSSRSEVERTLEALLPTGEIGMDRIAREVGCSRQTLYRRLKEEGTTFERVLDSLRRRMALRFIDRDGLGVKQTAYMLGFSEPASFSRAFKRWTGRSPSRRS